MEFGARPYVIPRFVGTIDLNMNSSSELLMEILFRNFVSLEKEQAESRYVNSSGRITWTWNTIREVH